MTRSTLTKSPSRDQVKAFRKAARELGADAGDDQFKDVLRTLAKFKPESRPKKTRTKATGDC
jgi:hypothetical protein